MTISAERAAVANAFLFRCGGIPDLALTYLKEAVKLACQAAGRPFLAAPPRGQGERFLDWLDAAREAGAESQDLAALREALLAVPKDPPPFRNVSEIAPAAAGELVEPSVRRVANYAYGLELSDDATAAAAAYWLALLIEPTDEFSNFNLAIIYQRSEDWPRSTTRFEQILKTDPNNRPALIGLHNLAFSANQMSRLAPHLEAYVRLTELPGATEVGDDAPPVIALNETNAVAVGRLVLNRGAAHVTSAVRPAVCERLRAAAEHWFLSDPRMLSVPVIKFLPEYADASAVLEPAMLSVLFTIFGRMPEISAEDTYLRRVAPQSADTYIPFHQDSTALANAGLNVWIPLIDCGVDAPGLEIMARRTGSILPTITSAGDYNQMEIDPALVYDSFPEQIRFYPTPKVGDAVLFLGTTVHRSHIAPTMTRERSSVELRFY